MSTATVSDIHPLRRIRRGQSHRCHAPVPLTLSGYGLTDLLGFIDSAGDAGPVRSATLVAADSRQPYPTVDVLVRREHAEHAVTIDSAGVLWKTGLFRVGPDAIELTADHLAELRHSRRTFAGCDITLTSHTDAIVRAHFSAADGTRHPVAFDAAA